MNDGANPRAPVRLAHQMQAFAGPPRVIFPPATQVYPDVLRGKPKLAHQIPFFARPGLANPPPYHPPLFPDRLPGRPKLAHQYQFFATPAQLAFGYLAGYGAAGAATFVLALMPGTKVTYAWGTDIFKSYNGSEQRSNTTGPAPKRRIEGSAFLLDASTRDIRSSLQRSAAAGSTFLLALPYEELELTSDSSGTICTVASTASCDWAIVTQRVAVIGPDGTTSTGVIQQVTSTTIRLDTAPGVAGKAGGRIMPLAQVLLDPQQGFARYPSTVDTWSIRATANVFGWVGTDSMGKGAQIVTYTFGVPVDQSTLVEADLLIWDRPNLIDGTASEAMLSGADVVDLGALPYGIGGNVVPDWARPIKYSSSSPADWQWLKAFIRQVLGRQKAFALSTNRPDLVFVSSVGSSMTVSSASVAGSGDYAAWYTSQAHRRLALAKADGTTQYVTVTGTPTDNGNGTLTLAIDAALSGTVTKVSFLETVRFDNNDSDDFPVTWDGGTFSIDWLARTSEEAINPPSAFMYDTVLSFVTTNLTPTDFEVVLPTLGQVNYVKVSGAFGNNIGGISVTAPGGAQDGVIVTLAFGNGSGAFGLLHEDTAWPTGDRMWLRGAGNLVWSGTVTLIFSSAVGRWVALWENF